jgi:DNA repair exonuclease SbcCD nuclease subunit
MEALGTENVTEENINEYSIIFAHQEFKGCKMGAMLSVNGDEWKPEYPMCISGHIHDHQHLQGNILYPGTPYQISYGSAPSKGVLMVDIKDNKEINYEYYDLKLPKKMIVHLTPDELSKYTLPENCFVKLVCKGESKAIKEVTKLDSVKELLKNPRVKLAIQEDRSKTFKNDLPVASRMETIPFQKRLLNAIESSDDNVKSIFTGIFGSLKV